MLANVLRLILHLSVEDKLSVSPEWNGLWPRDLWHSFWHIPRGQSWAFRKMGNMGLPLSPCLPVALFHCWCVVPTANFREDSELKIQGQPCGLWKLTRVFLHLVSHLLSFAGLGAVLHAVEPCWRGEELHFSEELSGTPWNTASQSLPAVLSPFSGNILTPASFMCTTVPSIELLLNTHC